MYRLRSQDRSNNVLGSLAFTGYIFCIVAANWAITNLNFVPVGLGLVAPAGVYFVGITFTLRDIMHETHGRRLVILAIAIGCILSYFLASQEVALASGSAFFLSELADFLVYSPLRAKNFLLAVAISNTVGLFLDSVLFLWLAFGSLAFLWGQIFGKMWMTLLALVAIALFQIGRDIFYNEEKL